MSVVAALFSTLAASVVAAIVGPLVTHHLQQRSERERLGLTCQELHAGWIRPDEPGWQSPVEGSCGPGPMRLSYGVEISNRGKSSAVLHDLHWCVRDAFGEGFYYHALGTGPRVTLERLGDRPVDKPVGPGLESKAFKIEPGEHARLLYEDDFMVFDVLEDERGPEGPAPRPVFGYRGQRDYLESGEEPLDLRTRSLLVAAWLKAKVIDKET